MVWHTSSAVVIHRFTLFLDFLHDDLLLNHPTGGAAFHMPNLKIEKEQVLQFFVGVNFCESDIPTYGPLRQWEGWCDHDTIQIRACDVPILKFFASKLFFLSILCVCCMPGGSRIDGRNFRFQNFFMQRRRQSFYMMTEWTFISDAYICQNN